MIAGALQHQTQRNNIEVIAKLFIPGKVESNYELFIFVCLGRPVQTYCSKREQLLQEKHISTF